MVDYTYPLIAIRNDGATIIATTVEEAIPFNHLRPGPAHSEPYRRFSHMGPDGAVFKNGHTQHSWIVRDDEGRVVLHEDLPRPERQMAKWRLRRIEEVRDAMDRDLPIPGTGVRRWRQRRSFARNITMRAAEAALDIDLVEWGVEGMRVGRRRAKHLPVWSSDVAHREPQRSWKHNRSTCWK